MFERLTKIDKRIKHVLVETALLLVVFLFVINTTNFTSSCGVGKSGVLEHKSGNISETR